MYRNEEIREEVRKAWMRSDEAMGSVPDALTPLFERNEPRAFRKKETLGEFEHIIRKMTPEEEKELRKSLFLLKADAGRILMDVIDGDLDEIRMEIEMVEIELHHGIVDEMRCPACGSTHVESESFSSYGGTTEGWTQCGFCDYSTSFADLSAVI